MACLLDWLIDEGDYVAEDRGPGGTASVTRQRHWFQAGRLNRSGRRRNGNGDGRQPRRTAAATSNNESTRGILNNGRHGRLRAVPGWLLP